MMKRILLAAVLVGLLFACGAGEGGDIELKTSSELAAVPPNFIVVVLDDWGWKDYGWETTEIKTPTMDAIADRGFVFENAFLTTSSCSPSRASILMGRYPTATGAPHLHDFVPEGFTSIPEELRKAGYYTESVGKWHLGGAFKARFDSVKASQDHGSEAQWPRSIKERPSGKPFFMWLSSFDPHLPHNAPEQFQVHDPNTILLPRYFVDTPSGREAYVAYLDEVYRVDYFIGELIDELETQGLLDSTWLFIVSDNGAPTPFAKTTLYDSGIKTPLLVLGPKGQGRFPGLVSIVDLAPTIIELAGLDVAAEFQGRSFIEAFNNPAYQHRKYVFAEQNNHATARSHTAVRSDDYLLIRNHFFNDFCARGMTGLWRGIAEANKNGVATPVQTLCYLPPPPVQFFQVEDEGYEGVNLAGSQDHAGNQKRLEQALDEWELEYRTGACPDIECATSIEEKRNN